jgi:serine/threonine protein kinase
MKVVTQANAIENVEENKINKKSEKKSGKRIGYNYIIVKSLKESPKNDVITCLYIKSLTNFGFCVIKEGTFGDTKDKHGRDIKTRLEWQKQLHLSLQDKVRMPRFLGSFEENGNYYLVLERIRGKSLYKACRENSRGLREGLITGNKLGLQFLGYMVQLINLLEILHWHQVVHLDVTAKNFIITPSKKMTVIDMELSYSLQDQYPSPPFELGTYGYMSPEQEATQTPAFNQDVFSVAAIILQIWTGISPSKLTSSPIEELTEKVNLFIPDKAFANIIVKCMHPTPEYRPTLVEIRKVIIDYTEDIKKKNKRTANKTKKHNRQEILDTIQRAIGTFSSPLLADPENGWFSENTSALQSPDKRKINKGWYTSFQKGACGVIYMLSKANMLGLNVEATKPYIDKGIKLIESKYISRLPDCNPGLFYGGSGIAAVLATSMKEGLVEPQAEYFDWIVRLLEKENNVINFQHGISGQGIANFICLPFLHAEKVKDQLSGYVNRLLQAQRKDGFWPALITGKRDKKSLGFAHGISGLIYFLLKHATFYNDQESLNGAEKGLQWLMKKAIREKDYYRWESFSSREIAPWWYDGGAGIALTFMKAYSLLGDERYKDFATRALYYNDSGFVDNNLGQCYGLCGLGEVYLEAFRTFQSEEWLERATWITDVLMHVKFEHSAHGLYWIIEHERQPVVDFGFGNSGVIHYLLRYVFPQRIEFPMSV